MKWTYIGNLRQRLVIVWSRNSGAGLHNFILALTFTNFVTLGKSVAQFTDL